MTYQMNVQTSPGEGLLSRRQGALLFLPAPETNSERLLEAFEAADEGSELDALAVATIEAELDVSPFAAVQAGADIVLRVFGSVELQTDLPSVPLLSAGASTTWVEHSVHGAPTAATVSAGEGTPDPRTKVVLGVVNAGGFAVTMTRPEGQAPAAAASPLEVEPTEGTTEQSDLLEYVLGAFPTPITEPQVAEPVGELIFDDGQKHVLTDDVVLGRNPVEKAKATKSDPLIVAGDRVSRAHLRVRVTGEQVWVEDCESRNGSVLVGSPNDEPFKLLANSPQEIEDGAVLYLGSRSFTFAKGEHAATPMSLTTPVRKDPTHG